MTREPYPNEDRERELKDQLAAIVAEIAQIREDREDDPEAGVFLLGWALAYEYTGVQIEKDQNYGAGSVTPEMQAVAMTRGLFAYGQAAVTPNPRQA